MKNLKLLFPILTILLLAVGCGGGGGGGETTSTPSDSTTTADETAPQVESYYPDPNVDGDVASADIQANGITVIFDEGMLSTTIDSASFKVEEWSAGGTVVSGTVTYDESVRTAKFIPETALASSWYYVVTVSTSVTDLEGNTLAADHTWQFMVATSTPPDSST